MSSRRAIVGSALAGVMGLTLMGASGAVLAQDKPEKMLRRHQGRPERLPDGQLRLCRHRQDRRPEGRLGLRPQGHLREACRRRADPGVIGRLRRG